MVVTSQHAELDSTSKDNIHDPKMVLLWYLLTVLVVDLTVPIHNRLLGTDNFRRYWPYDAEAGLSVIVCAISLYRPRIFRLSRWRPGWASLGLGLAVGIPLAWVQFLLASPEAFKSQLPSGSMLPVVLLGPILEEILFRGMFLNSLQSRLNSVTAIVLVTAMAAFLHNDFWMAILPQFLFCILYVSLERSLFASVTCHIVSNMIRFFPILRRVLTWRFH